MVDINIPLVVALVGADGVALCVGQQELYPENALAGHTVDLVNEGAASLPVGDLQDGGAAVLHLDLVGRIVQLVALGGFQFHHLIPALFSLWQTDNAVGVGGVGADNFPVQLAYLKLDALDTLSGFLVLLDDGKAPGLGIVDRDPIMVNFTSFSALRSNFWLSQNQSRPQASC